MRENRRRGKQGNIVRTAATFAVGAGIGSILALLFAPASGKATRRRLLMEVRNQQKVLGRRLGQATKVLATKAEYVREAATDWITEHVPHTNGKHARTIRHT